MLWTDIVTMRIRILYNNCTAIQAQASKVVTTTHAAGLSPIIHSTIQHTFCPQGVFTSYDDSHNKKGTFPRQKPKDRNLQ
jgi:hypothetical protein